MAKVTFHTALRDVATKEASVSGAVITAVALGIGYHEQLGDDEFDTTLKATKDRNGNAVPEGTRKVIAAAVRKLVKYRADGKAFADAPDRATAPEKDANDQPVPRRSEKVAAAIAAKPNDPGDAESMVAYIRAIMDAADHRAIATLPGRLDEIAGKVTAKGKAREKREHNGRNSTDKPDTNAPPADLPTVVSNAAVSDSERAETIAKVFGDITDTGIMAKLVKDLNNVLTHRLAQAQSQAA